MKVSEIVTLIAIVILIAIAASIKAFALLQLLVTILNKLA